MKKNILLFFPLLFGTTAFAQEILQVQNGASVVIQPGVDITVMGNVTLENGSTLSNAGSITLTQNNGGGVSGFVDNTVTAYNYGAGKIVFNSAGGNSVFSNNTFARIDVNAASLLLNSNIAAAKWYLQAGKVTTGAYTAIVSGNTTLALEASPGNTNFANSWVNGKLRRYINPVANVSYAFAVGDNTGSHLAVLDSMSASPITGVQYIDASFGPKPGTDALLIVKEGGASYTSVNDAGVWHLIPDNIPTAGKYNLKLFTNGFTGLTDNQFAILQRPDQSLNASNWTVPGGSSVNAFNGAGRLVADGYSLRKNVPGFGQFGIGQLSSVLSSTGGSTASVILWPNPSQNHLSIKIEGNTGAKQIAIIDAMGRIVRMITVTDNQQTDVYGLPSGTYVISVPNATGQNDKYHKKFVVVR